MTPAGVTNSFPVPTAESGVFGLAVVEGGVAFTESDAARVGILGYDGTYLQEWSVTAGTKPRGIVLGADEALYFVQGDQPVFGRPDRVGVVSHWIIPGDPEFNISDYELPVGGRGLLAIASAFPEDSTTLWLTEVREGELATFLTSLHPVGTGSGFTFALSGISSTNGIVFGPDQAMWFTESAGNRIGRSTLTGQITEFYIPTSGAAPLGITVGPDGDLWFAESAAGQLGHIGLGGAITEHLLPDGGSPAWVATGPDGNLWMTIQFSGKIARFVP